MIEFILNDSAIEFTINAVTEEPEPGLTFPLRFAFGPSDMPDVPDYHSIKFGEFQGNQYLEIPDAGYEFSVLGDTIFSIGFDSVGLFSNNYQDQNKYGWIGPLNQFTFSFLVIQGLDTSK